MAKVQLATLWSIVGGALGLAVLELAGHLTLLGWIAGLTYLAVSNALLARGLRRRGTPHFGWANAVTELRSTLVALITALVATSLTASVPVALLVGIAIPALALDAVDGWVARRTHSTSELGARFDMEVDAFLILVLSVSVVPVLGWWVLAIGAMRYALLVAERMLPWLASAVPPRYWRKVVAAYTGIALTAVASGWFPVWAEWGVTLLALALLVESFGRDVVWLARQRAHSRRRVAASVVVS